MDGHTERWDGDDRTNNGAANGEHWLAWLLALTALALGTIGLLAGFAIIGSGDVSTATAGAADEVAGTSSNWKDGMLWILPGITAAMLSYALHRNEHHMRRNEAGEAQDKLFNTEHMLAYLMLLGAIAAATIGTLIGFDVFDRGNSAEDGFLWHASSIGLGILTGTLHAVRHHQMSEDEEYIVGIIERRGAGRTTTSGSTVRERGSERL